MEGFIVFDYAKDFPTARRELAQWLSEGKLQRKETIIKGGLGAAEKALLALYEGINTGMFIFVEVVCVYGKLGWADLLVGKLLVEVKAENAGSRL